MFIAQVILDINSRFETIDSHAHDLRKLFESEASISQLQSTREYLLAACESLAEACPIGYQGTYLGRHLAFLKHYLDKAEPQKCHNDIVNICEKDLPQYHERVVDWFLSSANYDPDLKAGVTPLLMSSQWDSAIRKAFTLLKTRLTSTYGLPTSIDGEDLVNKLYGSSGLTSDKLDPNLRAPVRNLIAGLYGVFRNKYAHNHMTADVADVEAVLSMINWVLVDLVPLAPDEESNPNGRPW